MSAAGRPRWGGPQRAGVLLLQAGFLLQSLVGPCPSRPLSRGAPLSRLTPRSRFLSQEAAVRGEAQVRLFGGLAGFEEAHRGHREERRGRPELQERRNP